MPSNGSGHNSSSKVNNSLKMSSSKQTSTPSISSNQSKAYWNKEKEAEFEKFFDNWSEEMNQDYTKYEGGEMKTASGSEFPKMFDRFDLDGKPITIGLSDNGKGNYEYNVVMMYNHNSDKAPMQGHITYFFAFHNGEPVVLVDESTNGNRIQAKVTENKKLREGFEEIAKGDIQSISSSKSSSSVKSSTPKDSKTNLPGDEGLYPIPEQYQGTWYGYDSEGNEQKITFTGSKIITNSGAMELHKVDTDKLPSDPPSESEMDEAEGYGRAMSMTI